MQTNGLGNGQQVGAVVGEDVGVLVGDGGRLLVDVDGEVGGDETEVDEVETGLLVDLGVGVDDGEVDGGEVFDGELVDGELVDTGVLARCVGGGAVVVGALDVPTAAGGTWAGCVARCADLLAAGFDAAAREEPVALAGRVWREALGAAE